MADPQVMRTLHLDPNGPNGVGLKPSAFMDPSTITAGTPNEHGHVYFEDEFRGKLMVGVWQCDPATTRIESYPFTEISCVLEGIAEITDDSGHTDVYRVGDLFIIPAGMSLTYDMPEKFKKHFIAFVPEANDG